MFFDLSPFDVHLLFKGFEVFLKKTLIFSLSSLLLLKVKLEQACVGGDQALITCKQLLETWKQVYDSDVSG